MRTQVIYEWCYETVDRSSGDITDNDHRDKLSEFERSKYDDPELDLVLIRNTGNEAIGLEDRLWAYVKDGKLPEYFSNAYDVEIGIKVPLKYHNELAYYLK